jgi:hypothetical protein
MFKEIVLGSVFTFAALGVFTPDAEAHTSPEEVQAGEATINVPEGTKIVMVESTFNGCDPVYDEATETVYIPRCMSPSEQQGPAPTMPERIFDHTVDTGKREVENSITNAIGRKIFEMGNVIDETLGTY